MDKAVKLQWNVVKELKAANSTYPLTSQDFDEKFLRTLMKAIFNKSELENCARLSSLKALNASKLKFAKGIFLLIENIYSILYFEKTNLISILAIFAERVGADPMKDAAAAKRMTKFRAVAIDIGKSK